MNINMNFNLRDTLRWLLNTVLVVVGVLLSLRFVLKLFDAAADNEFVDWVYQTSGEIISPFRNMFVSADLDGAIIDFTTLFALVVYGLATMFGQYLIKKYS